MNRSHARPLIRMWEPSSKQREPERMEGMEDENGGRWPAHALRNMGGREGAATEVGGKPELSISRGWPGGQMLLQLVEEELEGVALEFGGFWGPWQMVQEGQAPFLYRDLPLQKPLPPLGGGLREATGTQLFVPSLPSTPLSAWRSGWACAGRLAHCQQLFLQPRQGGNWP